MNIDGLHLALLGFLFTVLGGVVVFFLTKSMFVRRGECRERHENVQERLGKGEDKFGQLENQVRALVVYHPTIPDDKKADLLKEERV